MASPELTDPGAPRVRRARRLARRAFRDEQRLFLVEGAHAVQEALASAVAGEATVVELYATVEAATRHPELLTAAATAGVPVRTASEAVLAALSDTVTPQGLVAVCGYLDRPLADVLVGRPRLIALLAEVRDPGNAGAVLRVADAAGADAVVLSAGSVDPYNGKVVRASAGGVFHLPVVTGVPVLEAVERLRASGVQVLAADGAADLDLFEADAAGLLAGPTAWLFGNEAWGLGADRVSAADAAVRVPILGRADSLNLATAAAVCLYASARAQRRA